MRPSRPVSPVRQTAPAHTRFGIHGPDFNHVAIVNTRRSTFDTALGVYTGNAVNALTLVATNDDITPNLVPQSEVKFNASAAPLIASR